MKIDKLVFEIRCYKKVLGFEKAVERVKDIYCHTIDQDIDKASYIILKNGL